MYNLKYELQGDHEDLEISGTTKEVAFASLRLIRLVYFRLLQRDPAVAEAFKHIIRLGINDAESPVFARDGAMVGTGVGVTIITPPKGGAT